MSNDALNLNSTPNVPEKVEEDRRKMDQIADELADKARSEEKTYDSLYGKITSEGPGSIS